MDSIPRVITSKYHRSCRGFTTTTTTTNNPSWQAKGSWTPTRHRSRRNRSTPIRCKVSPPRLTVIRHPCRAPLSLHCPLSKRTASPVPPSTTPDLVTHLSQLVAPTVILLWGLKPRTGRLFQTTLIWPPPSHFSRSPRRLHPLTYPPHQVLNRLLSYRKTSRRVEN